jgi:CDP-diacylglycerol pyrophosphatase
MMDFSDALRQIKLGYAVTRDNWNGPHQFITMQVPDQRSKMTLPYIYISTVDGDLVPWLASQTDLLSSDWLIAEDLADDA